MRQKHLYSDSNLYCIRVSHGVLNGCGWSMEAVFSPQSITAGLVALTWLSVSHVQISSDSVSASP